MPAPEKIREVYDRLAPWYDLGQWLCERAVWRRYRRRLLARARGRVLEVGIGTGANLEFYAGACPVSGVDLSAGMLRRALARAYRLRRSLDVETMDGEALAFPDRSFDTVVCTLTLCTTPDPLRLLRECGRVCRPGGRVLLLDHGLSASRAINGCLARFEPRHCARYACHLTRDVAAMPAQAGLTLVHQERHLWGLLTMTEARPTVS